MGIEDIPEFEPSDTSIEVRWGYASAAKSEPQQGREGGNASCARVWERSGEVELLSDDLRGDDGRELDCASLWGWSRPASASAGLKGGRDGGWGSLDAKVGLARREASVDEVLLGL